MPLVIEEIAIKNMTRTLVVASRFTYISLISCYLAIAGITHDVKIVIFSI